MANITGLTKEIAAKRVELAALEERLAAEYMPGLVCVVKECGYHGDIPAGTLVRITDINSEHDHPVTCEFIDGSDYDRFTYDQIEPVTRESARAYLIAEVDRKIAEAFG